MSVVKVVLSCCSNIIKRIFSYSEEPVRNCWECRIEIPGEYTVCLRCLRLPTGSHLEGDFFHARLALYYLLNMQDYEGFRKYRDKFLNKWSVEQMKQRSRYNKALEDNKFLFKRSILKKMDKW